MGSVEHEGIPVQPLALPVTTYTSTTSMSPGGARQVRATGACSPPACRCRNFGHVRPHQQDRRGRQRLLDTIALWPMAAQKMFASGFIFW
jgi:hypothetical protein